MRVDGRDCREVDARAFTSVRSAGPHRVIKYDTIGEVHDMQCGDILAVEAHLRSDETPAFGKKYKSMVSELSDSEFAES